MVSLPLVAKYEVLLAMPFTTMVFELRGISTLRPASEHWLPARFQRSQLRMKLQRLHVSRGRFRETPLNVINHNQHIQSRSPTEPDKSENTLKDNAEDFFQESASPRQSDKAELIKIQELGSNPLLQSLRRVKSENRSTRHSAE